MPLVSKPVIVIVHGAFHPPVYYRKLIEPLRASGYTVLAPAMPTTGLDDSVAGTTYRDDVRRIYESLLPLLDEGREAVVVGHSQVRMRSGAPLSLRRHWVLLMLDETARGMCAISITTEFNY